MSKANLTTTTILKCPAFSWCTLGDDHDALEGVHHSSDPQPVDETGEHHAYLDWSEETGGVDIVIESDTPGGLRHLIPVRAMADLLSVIGPFGPVADEVLRELVDRVGQS